MFAFLTLLICILFPSADVDRDGFTGNEERAHGCDAFDAENYPVCVDLDGDGVGETAPIAPLCEVYTDGLAPCA